jgi:hypothetical protein
LAHALVTYVQTGRRRALTPPRARDGAIADHAAPVSGSVMGGEPINIADLAER